MDIITINAGGTIFQTSKTTLLKSPYFTRFFDSWHDDSSTPIFLDVDPQLFLHVLNSLRDAAYIFPSENQNIIRTMDYFGLKINETPIKSPSTINILHYGYHFRKLHPTSHFIIDTYKVDILEIIVTLHGTGNLQITTKDKAIMHLVNFDIIMCSKIHTSGDRILKKIYIKQLMNIGEIRIDMIGQISCYCTTVTK